MRNIVFDTLIKVDDNNIEQDLYAAGCINEDDEKRLNACSSNEEVVECILGLNGAWSIIYYRLDLNSLFVGRDVMGRLSLVWTRQDSSLWIGCAVDPSMSSSIWHEVPYGQLTVIDLKTSKGRMYSYLDTYPDGTADDWITSICDGNVVKNDIKHDLLSVSRVVDNCLEYDPVELLYNKLKEICRKVIKGHQQVCIAFSGGIDSLLVAYAALEVSEIPIVLINVAFGETIESMDLAPDRKRAIEAYAHLRQLKNKNFRLLLKNVFPEQVIERREKFIAHAMAPASTVLDDSLACVLWSALEGNGNDYVSGEFIKCEAKLFLVGSGADELFAGYARHRHRYEKDGHSYVAEECENELLRLGSRNGGRDSRVATQLNKHLFAPFLDDDFVSWANKLPVLAKCDLALPRGEGEKRIIRQALMRLNAPHSAPKQAMQFGSRMAKLTNVSKKTKGSDQVTTARQTTSISEQ